MTKLNKNIFSAIILLLFLACTGTKTITDADELAYADKVKDLNPNYAIYHHQEDQSYLYFELQSKELLYVRENISQPFASTVSIHYKLFNESDKKTIIDSATNLLVDKKKTNSFKRIIGKIPIPVKKGENYWIKVLAVDLNKKVQAETKIFVNKKDQSHKQFFLVEKANNEVCFTPYFTQNEKIKIKSAFNPDAQLSIDFYYENTQIAKPPFSDQQKDFLFNNESDSLILLQFIEGVADIDIMGKGNYLIKVNNEKSFDLSYISNNYPEVVDYQGMIEPIRYICTNKEYKALQDAEDKRKAVEEFWLRISGNKERAKILIREYYRRIFLANKYFTSYKEGWRTDRGMLSIVMGYPNTISTSSKGETWVYGTASNMMMSLSFTFDKRNEQFVSNDFQLDRYRTYKDYWYRAVENWRQGRVYSFN